MYEHTFYTPERLEELFEMFTSLVKLASPGFLIWVAITMAGLLLTFIVHAFRKGADQDDDDDRDYDIKHY